MFLGASQFNGDIRPWKVFHVVDMTNMFRDASAFNSDISGWDTSNAREMHSMFSGATSFNQDISSWNVAKVSTMTNMLVGASSFNQSLCKWGKYLSNRYVGVPGFVENTACPNQTSPDLFRDPPGPFCYNCDDSSALKAM